MKYEHFPSRTTLNILARFNGFNDWESFRAGIDGKINDDILESTSELLLNANTLNIGDKILIKWDGEKECILEYISYLRFMVLDSRNIKLLKGDTGTVNSICIGLPFFMTDIQRGSTTITAYIGAKDMGIREFRPLIDKA